MAVVYIKNHDAHAGKWIYRGYKLAWEACGYEVRLYDNLENVKPSPQEYCIMALDSDVKTPQGLELLANAMKSFVFVQPNTFPSPWGSHPNFISLCPDIYIEALNRLKNVHLWTFADSNSYYHKWGHVNTLPLAYDSISYKFYSDKDYQFDVCYIGGWANNGFNEKKKIMLDFFAKIGKMNIKSGIFINKSLTHEQENKILSNSKICINIHDAYQRNLGFDTNERTFKSLGLNGFLISDRVSQIEKLLPSVVLCDSPVEMCNLIEINLQKDLTEVKETNRKEILENHTYINRVRRMEAW